MNVHPYFDSITFSLEIKGNAFHQMEDERQENVFFQSINVYFWNRLSMRLIILIVVVRLSTASLLHSYMDCSIPLYII